MAFQLQGGNPAASDYDYQSGSGMDTFLSRSIDEVSWQAQLGTTYNSLTEIPIGSMPTTATPTNYDATQISGSQGGSSTLGGSTGGSAAGNATAGAGITFNAGGSGNNIEVYDGNNNRALFGYNPNTNTWGFFATPPGTDISSANAPTQFSMSTDYSALLVIAGNIVNFPTITGQGGQDVYQAATVTHNLGVVPLVFCYLGTQGAGGTFLNFPNNYWQLMVAATTFADNNGTSYQYNYAVDQQNLYINRFMNNTSNYTASAGTVTYFICQQTAASSTATLPQSLVSSGLTL